MSQNIKVLIEIVYNRLIKKKQLEESTFKIRFWEDTNIEYKNITGENLGIDELKEKFFRIFSLAAIGEGFGNSYGKFKSCELEHEYFMLVEIFKYLQKLDHALVEDLPTVDEERAIEGTPVVGDNMQEFDKKRKNAGSSTEYQHKEAKISRLETLKATLINLIEEINGKTEASKLKVYLDETQADSQVTNPYSIEACMELLNSMEDISSKFYNNALVKFKDKDWRIMFIKMPSFRRKDWLASLE